MWPCRFDGDDAPSAPRVWALDLGAALAPHAPPEARRTAARQQARAALARALADALHLPPTALVLNDQRGQRVRAEAAPDSRLDARTALALATTGLSISHAEPIALIALHRGGPVGVDLATLPAGWAQGAPGAASLRPMAALYLGPDHAAARPGAAPDVFVQGWAGLEARLKCGEQPLAEWSATRQARLARWQTASLVLPPAVGRTLPAPHAAVVAWGAGSDCSE